MDLVYEKRMSGKSEVKLTSEYLELVDHILTFIYVENQILYNERNTDAEDTTVSQVSCK